MSSEMKWYDYKIDKARVKVQKGNTEMYTCTHTHTHLDRNKIWKADQLTYFSRIMTGMFCHEYMWVTSHRLDMWDSTNSCWRLYVCKECSIFIIFEILIIVHLLFVKHCTLHVFSISYSYNGKS